MERERETRSRSTGRRVGVKAYDTSVDLYGHKSNISRPAMCKDVVSAPKPRSRAWYSDREMKRRKRIATYKYYSVEGKVKSSFRKSIRWFKNTCSKIVHGF